MTEAEKKIQSILYDVYENRITKNEATISVTSLIDEQVKKALDEVEKSLNFCYTWGNSAYINGHNDGVKDQSKTTQEVINKLINHE